MPEQPPVVDFETHPAGYRHWRLDVDGDVATLTLTVDEGDIPAARALYRRILPVIRLVGGHRYVSASKAALALMGLEVGPPRSPRLPLPEVEMPGLRAMLRELGLLPAA